MDKYRELVLECVRKKYSFVPPTTDINDDSWKQGFEIRCDIPGWNPGNVLVDYAKLASKVPEGGMIIEVGCGLGLTTWPLVYNSKNSVTVYAIDRWSTHPYRRWLYSQYFSMHRNAYPDLKTEIEEKNAGTEATQAEFERIFQGNSRVRALDMVAPPDRWELGLADLILIDVGHTYGQWFNNIVFWSKHLKEGGVIGGNDYFFDNPRDDFREIRLAIDDAAAELGKKVCSEGKATWTYV